MTELDRPGQIGPARAVGWSVLLALVVFAGSLGNGFAYDDDPIIQENAVVTEGQWNEAAFGPYWTIEGYGLLYRPVALIAYAAEWAVGGGDPLVFHLVNVLLHALATGLLSWLVLRLARMRPQTALLNRWADLAALVAGGFFALHPVHVEAVANGVGQGELWAAVGVLGAVHLYIWSPGRIWQRAVRITAIGACYAIGLGAKEIAVTLPLLLAVVDGVGRGWVQATARIRRESMVYLLLLAVLVAYLALRWMALGSFVGEEAASVFHDASTMQRVLTALATVPTILMLLFAPLRLAADYDPGVRSLAVSIDADVVLGASLLLGLALLVVVFWRRSPLAGYGVAWFLVAWSIVSNLPFATGVLLAERTLYLPSAGIAMAVGVGAAALADSRGLRTALVIAGVAGGAFAVRTATRVPVWFSTFTVMENLATEHPESWRADRTRAAGLLRVGEVDAALEYFESAVEKMPRRYSLLLEYGSQLREAGYVERAIDAFERAVDTTPRRRSGWVLLSEAHLIAGRYREAHRIAMRGIRVAGEDPGLWRVASEAYVGGGFLPAAIRARRVAAVLDPLDPSHAQRIEELLAVIGAPPQA